VHYATELQVADRELSRNMRHVRNALLTACVTFGEAKHNLDLLRMAGNLLKERDLG
jgi:hypothetical protein